MLFRHGTDAGKRATRSGAASEAQLKELRSKARRRLIGALALVLAAFIVVPWLFDEPAPQDTPAPVVVPATPAGLPPPASAPTPVDATAPSAAASADHPAEGTLAQGHGQAAGPTDAATGAPAAGAQDGRLAATTPPAPAQATPPAPEAPARPATQPVAPAAGKTPGEPEKPAKPKSGERTDDGSVALALLSGKSPSAARGATAPAASGQGRYYLQVAAYTTEQDAQSRRDSLRQSGVSDAYVERGQSGGRTVYRLRVGPFGSHEAAQAAQARLRALGYQNGLISDK